MFDEDKKYHRVRVHCYYTSKYRDATYGICNLRYKTSEETPAVFHNGSYYDYHFVIKGLAERFKGQFECLAENIEKHMTFLVPIQKKKRIQKMRKDISLKMMLIILRKYIRKKNNN